MNAPHLTARMGHGGTGWGEDAECGKPVHGACGAAAGAKTVYGDTFYEFECARCTAPNGTFTRQSIGWYVTREGRQRDETGQREGRERAKGRERAERGPRERTERGLGEGRERGLGGRAWADTPTIAGPLAGPLSGPLPSPLSALSRPSLGPL